MKALIERDALLTCVGTVRTVAKGTATIPILGNVLVQAGKAGLTISATDMDMVSSAMCAAEVEEAGAITLPAGQLHDFLRNLPQGAQIDLTAKDGQARAALRSSKSRAQMPVLPASDFPTFPEPQAPVEARMPATQLFRALEKVAFACSPDETRYLLTAVHLEIQWGEGDQVRLRSGGCQPTMIAWSETAAPPELSRMPAVALGRRLVAELRRILDGRTGEVEMAISESLVRFAIDEVAVVSKVIEGHTPPYFQHFEHEPTRRVEVDLAAFKAALKRCSLVISEKANPVRMAVQDGQLRLGSRSFEYGEADEELEAKIEGEGFELQMNAKHLLDILGQITGSKVEMAISDLKRPVIFHDPADRACGYLSMPLMA